MRKSLTLSLIAVTAIVAGTAALAQDNPAPGPAPRGDTTRADVEQRTTEMFGRMDLNKDGLLSDADREAARREAFDRADTDKDGSISFAEFEARRDDRREERAEGRGPGPDGSRFGDRGPDGPGFGGPGPRGDRGLARAADTDKDGTVTQAEFTTAALARFDRADANSDGTISLEERREARQHMRHDRRRGRPARDDG
jgi:hypothetical protein